MPGRGWGRAILLGQEGTGFRIFICDLGLEAVVPAAALRPLLPLLPLHRRLSRLTLALSLARVRRAGGGGWTLSAIEMADEVLGCGEVEARVVGPA